ncbi:helix-turn-helix protein [Paenibacillus methanolicus]|uniref:Helix-turn-helix protein n=2 Tax=Paenibacillus methanolicus TaxID=582686 RepID=A0A5S5CGL0_9BACL|nr:helix-turn-helix protein [Paenibacillus methanolicus]
MIQELRPDYQILHAKDGMEALASLTANPVDLVFTDIEMPIMDGLQFIEQMNVRGGGESIVIMSAYSHFEYARRAVQLGACDYLLKPIEEEKVTQTLLKAESKYKTEQLASIDMLLARVLEGASSPDDIRLLEKSCPVGKGGVLAIEFKRPSCPGMPTLIRRQIMERVGQWSKEQGVRSVFHEPDRMELLMAVLTADADDSSFWPNDLRQRLQPVIEELSCKLGIELTIGAGEPFYAWGQDVHASCERALLALQARFYHGGNACYTSMSMALRSHAAMMKLDTGLLTRAIQSGDKPAILNGIRAATAHVLEKGMPSPEAFKLSLAASIHQLHACLSEKGHAIKDADLHEETFLRSGDWTELWEAVEHWVACVTDQLDNRKHKRNESIIETCKSYIESHYAEELSLSLLAEKFHFNASYFCMLFKNNTRTTVSQYIIQTRMNHAASMLRQTTLKVYEIAAMVGYKDVKYFIRLFRKEYGASPDEYRHLSATR